MMEGLNEEEEHIMIEEETLTGLQQTVVNFQPCSNDKTQHTANGRSTGNNLHWREVALVRNVSEIFHSSSTKSSDRKDHDEGEDPAKLPIRERIRHFTWTWFMMTMATGGIANVLYAVPEPMRFPGLYAIGCIFFLFNICLFLFNICFITIRFALYPSTFRASFLHPTESLFVPAAVTSFGTILINITQYGVGHETGEWLEQTMIILYWFYCGLSVVSSAIIYLILWSTQTFTISQMTPVWIFPAYPLLIVGPHAGQLATKVSPERAVQIIVGGYTIQGIGFMVSLMIYSAFIYRLMTQKLPKENVRPGMFVSVGPSGFTIAGLITMGQALPKVVDANFMGDGMGELVGKVSMIVANWVGIWLWGLAFWFFLISVGAHFASAAKGRIHFAMTWFSFVFPNTALTTATFAVDIALNGNRVIQIIGCTLALGVVITWILVFSMVIRAVILKQILWPQKQEDRNEGGWMAGDEKMHSVDRARETMYRRASAMHRRLNRNTNDEEMGRMPTQMEEVPSHDRADFAIKEARQDPSRGRKRSIHG